MSPPSVLRRTRAARVLTIEGSPWGPLVHIAGVPPDPEAYAQTAASHDLPSNEVYNLAQWTTGGAVHRSEILPLMSVQGQERTSAAYLAMSALPPKTDIERHDWNVRLVPKH